MLSPLSLAPPTPPTPPGTSAGTSPLPVPADAASPPISGASPANERCCCCCKPRPAAGAAACLGPQPALQQAWARRSRGRCWPGGWRSPHLSLET